MYGWMCVHTFKHEYLCNQSTDHNLNFVGKAAFSFGLDPIRALVSMATDSSHRVIMEENRVNTLAPSFLN